jgi:DNA-binding IclR family transcriptional regulator
LAVPVYGHGKVIAGLSVYVPESRYTTSSQNKWQNWLAEPLAGYLKNYRADKWAGRLGN